MNSNKNAQGIQGMSSEQSDNTSEEINAFIDKSVGISRKRLNIQSLIGFFIFGWLMKENYEVLGQKFNGQVVFYSMMTLFIIGSKYEPLAFALIPVIYIAAWIHVNTLLTNKQKEALGQFLLSTREKTNIELDEPLTPS